MRVLQRFALFVALCLAPGGVALANQTPPAFPASETRDPAAVADTASAPISLNNLTRTLLQTRSRLRQISDLTQRQRSDRELENIRTLFQAEVDAADAQFLSRPPQAKSLRDLQDGRDVWTDLRKQTDEWEGTVAERLDLVDEVSAELKRIRERWVSAREAGNTDVLSAGALARIDSLLAEVDNTTAKVEARRRLLLWINDMVAAWAVQISDRLVVIGEAADARRRGLFRVDGTPIWRVFAVDSAATEVHKTRPPNLALLAHVFWQRYSSRLILHTLITIVLIFGLRALRRRAWSAETQDIELQTGLRILTRSVSTSFLLLWMPTLLLYPRAPHLFLEVVSILTILACVRLIPILVPRVLVKVIFGVFIVGLVLHFGSALPLADVGHRVARLLTLTIGVVMLVSLMRRDGLTGRLPTGWRWAEPTARMVMAAAAVAIAANIVGAVALGEHLGRSLMACVVLATMYYTTARVLMAVLVVTLSTGASWLPRFVRGYPQMIQHRVGRALGVTLFIVWVLDALREFRLFDPIVGELLAFVTKRWSVGNVEVSIAGTSVFFFIVWLSTLVSRFIRFVLREDVLPHLPLKRGMPDTVLLMVNYTVMAIGLILALASLGLETTQFTVLAGALGVGVGFGLQTIVNNFVSGLILMFERPIQIGDTVEVDTLLGVVTSIGIRASIIRTFAGAEVIVPNGNLLAGQVINWTRSDQQRRVEVAVGVAYGTNPERVIELLTTVVAEMDGVLGDPPPQTLFTGFGDSSLSFELRFWTSSDRYFQMGSQARARIYAALEAENIEIPFPQRDLHLKSGFPPSPPSA